MPILLIFLLSFAFGEAIDVRSLKEKTYTRDNTFCRFESARIEFQIRSESPFSELGEKKYGEHIFYYPKTRIKLLPLNADKLHNFRFFEGSNSLCSKSYGFSLGNDKIAVLFLKENRPFMDKLSFQVFNLKTLHPENVVDTEYISDKAETAVGGFLFRTYAERQDLEMGSVKINNIEYFFQDRDFPIWMKYTTAGFEINPSASYQKFNWKKHYKDEKEFLAASAWDETEKKFKNAVFYIAVNHKLKKECILLMPTKTKISGNETWHCL